MLHRASSPPHRVLFGLLTLLVPLGAGAPRPSQAQFVATRYTLTGAERDELTRGRDRLGSLLQALKLQSRSTNRPTPEQIPDVEIFYDAVDRALRQSLFFAAREVAAARSLIAEGERRAASLFQGETPWDRKTGIVLLGHRSRVDGSAQPYQVLVPENYPAERARRRPERVDIFLHGRGGTLSEINFLSGVTWPASSFGGDRFPFLILYPYGRGNNGWRFAGEQDMFEALADMQRRYAIDPDRTFLRGYSMGGHGAWHIGLQHPGAWAAMSPGAGFTDTIQYQQIAETLPPWQHSLLHMYDPVDYVGNGRNLPVLAYVGDQDPAIGQHQLIVGRLRKEGVPFEEFIGPETPHRYEPKAREAILSRFSGLRRRPDADEIHFVTYTLRFDRCKWVRVTGLRRHWERAVVQARRTAPDRIEVTTENITALTLTPTGKDPVTVKIDGQTLDSRPVDRGLDLIREGARWRFGAARGLRKRPGVQGPIDDALFGPVLAVTGTETPWSSENDRWIRQETARFRTGWDEYFRGGLPERTDATVTRQELREHNLYLFGDPGSNAVLRRLLPKLPLRWTRDRITLAGETFPAEGHLPVLVFPNPENPDRYVVLNVGFTFSRADWNGSNARQYAHLPDYAVLKVNGERYSDDHRAHAALAGFFDERWRPAGEDPERKSERLRSDFRRALDRPRVPPAPRAISSETRGDLIQEKWTIATEEKERAPILVVRPAGVSGRLPVVVCLHGLGGRKEGMAPYLEGLARRKIIGVALDARYHGDRAGDLQAAMAEAFRTGKEHPYLWDTVWDVWRVLDYLETRPDVDPARIGVMGVSLGGHTTWMASADPRVRVAVPCISACSWRWQLEYEGYGQRVRNLSRAFARISADLGAAEPTRSVVAEVWRRWHPGVPETWDCQDLLGAFAPRPLLLLNGDQDPVAPLPGLQAATWEISAAYRRAAAPDHLRLFLAEKTGHTVTPAQREALFAWFEKWLATSTDA